MSCSQYHRLIMRTLKFYGIVTPKTILFSVTFLLIASLKCFIVTITASINGAFANERLFLFFIDTENNLVHNFYRNSPRYLFSSPYNLRNFNMLFPRIVYLKPVFLQSDSQMTYALSNRKAFLRAKYIQS